MSKQSGPSVVSAKLAQRLRAVAEPLAGGELPRPDPDPGRDSSVLLDLVVRAVQADRSHDRVWLLSAAVFGAYPTSEDVIAATRYLQLASPAEAAIWLLDRALRVDPNGAAFAELRVVSDRVVVDVDHSARFDLHTGIQQVVRQTLPLWERDHPVVAVAWTASSSGLRPLCGPERQRVSRGPAGPGQSPTGAAGQAGTGVTATGDGAEGDGSGPSHSPHRPGPEPGLLEGDPGADTALVVPWRSVVVLAGNPARARVQPPGRPGPILRQPGGGRRLRLHPGRQRRPGARLRAPALLRLPQRPQARPAHLRHQRLRHGRVRRLRLRPARPGPPRPGRATSAPCPPGPPPTTARPRPDARPPLVLCVGSLEPRKNHLALLYAAERLWREGLDFQLLLIAGSGWGEDIPAHIRHLQHAGRPLTIRTSPVRHRARRRLPAARFSVWSPSTRATACPSPNPWAGAPPSSPPTTAAPPRSPPAAAPYSSTPATTRPSSPPCAACSRRPPPRHPPPPGPRPLPPHLGALRPRPLDPPHPTRTGMSASSFRTAAERTPSGSGLHARRRRQPEVDEVDGRSLGGESVGRTPVWFDYLVVVGCSAVLCIRRLRPVTGCCRPLLGCPGLPAGGRGHCALHLSGATGAPSLARRPRRRRSQLLQSACASSLSRFALWNAIDISHHVAVAYDPGVYTVAGRWLASHSSLVVPAGAAWGNNANLFDWTSVGMYRAPGGTLEFQFAHLVPVLLAEAHQLGGDALLFRVPAVLGALALCAIYATGCRLIRRPWLMLAAISALAVSLPQLYFSRNTFSEPATQVLLWGGIWLLLRAYEERSTSVAFVGGLAMGGTLMTRIDGVAYLMLLPLLAAVGWLAARNPGRAITAPADILAVVVGVLPPAILGTIDVQRRSGPYYHALHHQVRELYAVLGLSTLVAIG